MYFGVKTINFRFPFFQKIIFGIKNHRKKSDLLLNFEFLCQYMCISKISKF
jgi:hypothetical protein